MFVAVSRERIVGFASVELFEWNGLARIHGLAVAPDATRRGIGSRLVAEVERFARMSGARGVYVDTPVTNHGGRAFYRANGYAEDHVMSRYYADDLDGVTLAKFFS